MSNGIIRLPRVKARPASSGRCPACGAARLLLTGPDGTTEPACPRCEPGAAALASAQRAAATGTGMTVRLMHAMVRLARQMAEEHRTEHVKYCGCHWCRHQDTVVGEGRSRAEVTRAVGMLDAAADILGDLVGDHELGFTEDTYEGELRELAAFCDGIPE